MESAQSSSTTSLPRGVFPWKVLLSRTWPFLVGGFAGWIASLVAAFILDGLFNGDKTGGDTIASSYPLTILVVFMYSIICSVAGVLFNDWWAKKETNFAFRNQPGAIAAAQKTLFAGVILSPFVGGLFTLIKFFPESYWFTPAVGVFLVTLALGYTRRQQIMWLIGCCSLIGLMRAIGFLFTPDAGEEPLVFMFSRILGAVVGLIFVLILIKRTTQALKAAGLKVGAFGVRVRDFPPLAATAGTVERTLPTQLVDSARQVSPVAMESIPFKMEEVSYYYVGPNNEPIGPISRTVLFQLRQSGAITDQTMVAPEGGTEWRPMSLY